MAIKSTQALNRSFRCRLRGRNPKGFVWSESSSLAGGFAYPPLTKEGKMARYPYEVVLAGRYYGSHPEIQGFIKKASIKMSALGADLFDRKELIVRCRWDEITGFDNELATNSDAYSRLSVTRMATLGVFSLAAPKRSGRTDNLFIYNLHTSSGDIILENEIGGSSSSHIIKFTVSVLKKESAKARTYVANYATGKILTGQPQDDSVSQLERLAELKDKGILTADEFEAKKKQILGL